MKVHFIGIGGIGTSALAQYYLKQGWEVTGSDLTASEITTLLKRKEVKVFLGKHKAENLPPDVNKVIYSLAVPPNNVELKKAKLLAADFKSPISPSKIQSYAEALGELTKQYESIAVAGTHGKSTTGAMLALILIKAGLDPTVILGTKLKEFDNSNFRAGESKYLLLEADEWQASFLNYWPRLIVLTNIEREHLDFYHNLEDILKTYGKFVSHLPKGRGILVVNKDQPNTKKLLHLYPAPKSIKTIFYSLKQPERKTLKKILKVPGEHNISNALAALAAARALNIPDKIIFEALSEYQGAWRRFEIFEIAFGGYKLKVVSDYAHHPTEIEATLRAAREKFPDKKIWIIFQPHQYQRTFYLFDDFVKVFKRALWLIQGQQLVDKIIITDIYDVAGREENKIKRRVSSKKLAKAIGGSVVYLPFSLKGIVEYLKKNLKSTEVLIIAGAGDIYKLVDELSTSNGVDK